MRRALIDTNIYSLAMRGDAEVVDRLQHLDEIGFSVVSLGELLVGFRTGSHGTKRIEGDIAWQADEDHSPCLDFRAEVRSDSGWPLFVRGSYNPLIAALSYNLILKRITTTPNATRWLAVQQRCCDTHEFFFGIKLLRYKIARKISPGAFAPISD